jgi:hypothetical protein
MLRVPRQLVERHIERIARWRESHPRRIKRVRLEVDPMTSS